MARSTPICWRRSTTVRLLTTPNPAMPTTSPRARKPWNSARIPRRKVWPAANISERGVAFSPLLSIARSSASAVSPTLAPGATFA